MPIEIKESDWKLFRRLHQVALERFCEQVLNEVQETAGATNESYHERYIKVYGLLRTRDKEMADAFNDARRSKAYIMLAIIMNQGLLTAAELDQFSPEARQIVDAFRNINGT